MTGPVVLAAFFLALGYIAGRAHAEIRRRGEEEFQLTPLGHAVAEAIRRAAAAVFARAAPNSPAQVAAASRGTCSATPARPTVAAVISSGATGGEHPRQALGSGRAPTAGGLGELPSSREGGESDERGAHELDGTRDAARGR